ncbi:hypothetical protein [Dokdonia sp.]|uniref:hypothetical protein n=1 Tax=Dokdonia sp. TaxID=2024995 RepID=UPI0032640317
MKSVISPIIIVTAIILISCGGHKSPQFEKENALVFTKATYAKWVAGVKGGGAGYTINIIMAPSSNEAIQLDSLYYKNYAVDLISNGDKVYSGHIDTGENREVNSPFYDSAPKEKPKQEIVSKNVFELTGDEAVVSYTQNGITKYYKFLLTKDTSAGLPK